MSFDASSEGSASAASLTFSHTIGSGSNRILWVGAYATDGATMSGVTFNGVAMSTAGTPLLDPNNRRLYLWYLLAPATGAHDVVISITSGSPNIRAVSASYTDAAQSGVPDAYITKTDSTSVNSYSESITTVANNAWAVMIALTDQSMTATGAAFKREEHADQNLALFDTNGPISPAGATAMGVSYTFASTIHALVLASFAPDGGAPPPRRSSLMTLGVG